MKKDLISIVVPCYNEGESLPIFYGTIDEVSKKIKANFEFIFINDGSSDNTLDILRSLSLKDKRVKYISFSRNFGKEAAILAGFKRAEGNFVATMDADLQDPPEKLVEMYKNLKEDDTYDVVALCSPSHEGYSIIRKFFTNTFYKLIKKLSSTPQMPGARDFRLMHRYVVKAILDMPEYNRYIKGIFSYVGFNTKWVEYKAPDRVAGSTTWNFFSLFKYAIEGIVAFSTTPLIISAVVGLILCLLSLIFVIIIIFKTLIFGDPVSGWPSLACLVTFIGGIELLSLGVIGLYLSKTYLEVKKRPIYIIKETEKEEN